MRFVGASVRTLVLALLALPATTRADPPSASITLAPDRTQLGPEDEVRIALIIEVPPNQLSTGCPNAELGLGGYQVGFTFDTHDLEFLRGELCPDTPPEYSLPSFTNPPAANQNGWGLAVCAARGAPDHKGRACYGLLAFRARPGASGRTQVGFGIGPSQTILISGMYCFNGPLVRFQWSPGVLPLDLGVLPGAPAKGDLNLDSRSDVLDAVTLSSCLVGNTKIGQVPFLAAPSSGDLNGDKTLDVLDLVDLVARIVRGPAGGS